MIRLSFKALCFAVLLKSFLNLACDIFSLTWGHPLAVAAVAMYNSKLPH